MASAITTHVLDTSIGKPAAGVPVTLERWADERWHEVGRDVTNSDGRTGELAGEVLTGGTYRLTFDVSVYFADTETFYPFVRVVFNFADDGRHCHVPLLLSPFGYSTYRGS